MNVRRFSSVLAGVILLLGFASPAQATFAGQNGRITYTQSDVDFTYENVWTMSPHGSHQTRLIAGVTPAYSPDGRRIAFTSDLSKPPGSGPSNDTELYVMNTDGTHVRRITFSVGYFNWQPAWSPDGEHLVWMHFLSSEPPPGSSPQTDLWIVDLQTGVQRNLTNTPDTWEAGPQWSPDGKRIAYDSDLLEPGNNDIYTIRPDGFDLRRLTRGPGYDETPNYSPNGDHIAFDSDQTGNGNVFVMRTDGSQLRQLTNNPDFEGSPAFSPDGRFIAYDRGDIGEIFRMRADGSQQTNLTRTPQLNEFGPDWQRLGT
jgi:TolB protein